MFPMASASCAGRGAAQSQVAVVDLQHDGRGAGGRRIKAYLKDLDIKIIVRVFLCRLCSSLFFPCYTAYEVHLVLYLFFR